jgi:hypothetical protein
VTIRTVREGEDFSGRTDNDIINEEEDMVEKRLSKCVYCRVQKRFDNCRCCLSRLVFYACDSDDEFCTTPAHFHTVFDNVKKRRKILVYKKLE